MKFQIYYFGKSEDRTLIYREDEHSFDMIPRDEFIDGYVIINTLSLVVDDDKIIQLSGFCGLNKHMKSDITIPEYSKGALKVKVDVEDDHEDGVFYTVTKKEDWPIHLNIQTGWVCLGFPEKEGKGVEFINNCVAFISNTGEFLSLWLKPTTLPKL